MCPKAVSSRRASTPVDSGSCFSCTRLNPTTFQILEDDKYFELPIIYAKITESAIVLLDTGCGGAARDPNCSLRSLRLFLETYPVVDNENRPLNEGGKLDYVVICSHCHFDHIGAIEQFTDDRSSIWASSYDKSFIDDPDRLPITSLCKYLGMETPKYKVTHWADDLASMEHNGADLGTQIIHTPGHTPDELAVWDAAERTLYVGDTLYEGTAIVFPAQGNLKLYSESIGRLKELVKGWNADTALPRVKIACGHSTSSADAVEILDEVDAYLFEVVKGMVTPYAKENTQDLSGDGEESRWFFKRGGGKIAFGIPKRLIDDFEADTQAMATIEKRQNQ